MSMPYSYAPQPNSKVFAVHRRRNASSYLWEAMAIFSHKERSKENFSVRSL
jgi:hypothetical protein